jgi:peptidoglycan/xylan/chitin deacetylase (PgdA/CDA1 family)
VRRARRSSRHLGVALVYHRLGDPPGTLRSELVPALGSSLFAEQLRHLSRHFELVPASRLPEAVRSRAPGERLPIAITFDDDLRSHVEIAAPWLRAAGAPATFFLTGTSIGGPHAFWWERLQTAVDRGLDLSPLGLPASSSKASIHEVGRAIESLSPVERDEVDAKLEALVGPDAGDPGLRASDVESLAREGFEIGFHTRRHDPLTTLEDDELERALAEGRDQLEAHVGGPLRTIAYPHGRADARVARAAERAGYRGGFTGRNEALTGGSDLLLLGRISPSYASVGELAFDIAWKLARARER